MRTIPYSQISAGVCDLVGWDPDNLDSRQFSAIRRAVSQALGDLWDKYWWADLLRVSERTFRPPYSAATTYAAGEFVWFGGPRGYYQALQATTGNAPATLSGTTWTENSQYWAEAQTQPSGNSTFSAATAYVVGDLVTWLEDNEVYQCITAGTGNLPSTSAWAQIVPFDAYVDLLETGVTPLGRVRAVWDRNPGSTPALANWNGPRAIAASRSSPRASPFGSRVSCARIGSRATTTTRPPPTPPPMRPTSAATPPPRRTL